MCRSVWLAPGERPSIQVASTGVGTATYTHREVLLNPAPAAQSDLKGAKGSTRSSSDWDVQEVDEVGGFKARPQADKTECLDQGLEERARYPAAGKCTKREVTGAPWEQRPEG